jgi:hypothetical protein
VVVEVEEVVALTLTTILTTMKKKMSLMLMELVEEVKPLLWD